MPVNLKKGYGLITGHPWARYEQNGVLYDWEGNERPEEEKSTVTVSESVKPLEPGERDFALEHAKEFLKNVLNGGPVTKSAVYRACEANNQNWEKVQQAFIELKGEVTRAGKWQYWNLKEE